MGEEKLRDTAFAEMFDGFYGSLLQVAWRICGREDIAEELCQEAFLRYYERRDRLPEGVEARYWLIRVVKNLAFNYEKRQRRERDIYRSHAHQPRAESPHEGEQAVLTEESGKIVRKALGMVPYKLRIVLVLKEYANYPYSTIAKILRISENNVKIRVFRARQHLSKILNREDLYVP